MNLRLSLSLLSVIAFGIASCQSKGDDIRLLEKSRQNEPLWLGEGLGLQANTDGIRFVLRKEKVLDLPLGLHQTEEGALHNLRFQVFQRIIGQVDASHLSPKSAQDMHNEIGKILSAQVTEKNLKDFYFDKVSLPFADDGLIPEYYRIYALAHIDAQEYASIAAAIKAFVDSYPNEDLRSQLKSLPQL